MSKDEELKMEMDYKIDQVHEKVCQSLTNAYNTIGQKLTQIDQKIKEVPNSPDKINALRNEIDALRLAQEDLKKQLMETDERFSKLKEAVENMAKVATAILDTKTSSNIAEDPSPTQS